MAKVLIVEDNPANLTLAIFLLQSAGHTVLTATDAETGLTLAREEGYIAKPLAYKDFWRPSQRTW
jgi:CheY-like chemotaxis protein